MAGTGVDTRALKALSADLEKKTLHGDNPYTTPILKAVAEDSYKRLIAPAGEREISRMFYQEYLEDLRRREAQWRVQRH